MAVKFAISTLCRINYT